MNSNILTFDSWVPYYSFHMPLFAFISGYFFKTTYDRQPHLFIWKKIQRVLLPFFVISLVYLILQTILRNAFDISFGYSFSFRNWLVVPFTETQPWGFNIATWHMIALFLAECYYVIIRFLFSWFTGERIKDSLFLILFFALSAIIVSRNADITSDWMKVQFRSLFMILFLHAGYCYRNYVEHKVKVNAFAFFFVLFGCRAFLLRFYGLCDFDLWNCSFHDPWWVVLLSSFMGISFWLWIAKWITPIVSEKSILLTIGRNTRDIMAHHLFGKFLMQAIIYWYLTARGTASMFDFESFRTDLYYIYATAWGTPVLYSIGSIAISLGIAMLVKIISAKAHGTITKYGKM